MPGKVNRELLAISVSTALFFIAQSITASVIARYARAQGISIGGVGILWSITFIISMSLRPIAGELGDRTSPFLPMAMGSFSIALADLFFTSSSTFSGILVGRIFMGFASSFFIATSIAAATLAVPPDLSGKALAVRAAFVSLGFLIGPPVGGVIVDRFGYFWAFTLSMAIALLVGFISISKHPKGVRKRGKEGGSWREAITLVVVLGFFITFFAGSYFSSFQALLQANYKDLNIPSSYYGFVMASSSGVSTLVRIGVSKIIRKDVRHCLVLGALGYGIMTLSAIMLYFWYLPPYSYIVGAVMGIGTGFTVPSVQNAIALSTPSRARNRALAIYAMGFDCGSFAGPLTLSLLAQKFGYLAAYSWAKYFPTVSVAICLFLAYYYRNRSSS